ncbi:M15 family metallopeptidase, partial [Enterococcus faecium]
MEKGFTFLDEILNDVRWDAKYATWDNFTGKPIDGYEVNRIIGTYELADALLKVQELAFNRIRQKSPILYRWVMNAVRYEGYR